MLSLSSFLKFIGGGFKQKGRVGEVRSYKKQVFTVCVNLIKITKIIVLRKYLRSRK